MYYSAIHSEDLLNGEGLRVSLFVSGCNHQCRGCFSQKTWKPTFGEPFTEDALARLLALLEHSDGLSLLGGDPLYPDNRTEVEALCRQVKEVYPDKDIWLWTGYTLKELSLLGIDLASWGVDVLVDGKFEEDKPTLKPFRGSNNQELIQLSLL